MSLLSLSNVSFTWENPRLLDGIDFNIDRGDRIGLMGRNGCGKSTLLKIIAGEIAPDDGAMRKDTDVRITRLLQEVPQRTEGTIAEIVSQGWPADEDSDDSANEWKAQHAVEKILSRMSLDGALRFATLSSGMKRRVLLSQALVQEPQILLLDEPTNHLDIDAIAWLERFLKGYDGALVFVTHDRVFLQALASRIVEIERGKIFDWDCDYQTFLKRKQAALQAEEQQNKLFDQKLAVEERWIRQGIKARRTRNEGRVRALKKLRVERSQRRKQQGNVKLKAVESERSGLLVIETKNVSFRYEDFPIVRSMSTFIARGDKIGIVGPNGVGKTTLLKVLLGELKPNEGTVRHGTKLNVLYFDQLREQIDETKTVVENVGEGQDMLLIDGRSKHIYGYLQDFLFTPERARRPARYLSGGERNRMLLAKLFKNSSNLLVLDEPTNDLDFETLELLEEMLLNYAGTVLLVSHDRAFLNNVVTAVFAFDPDGKVLEYDGGYDDYARQQEQIERTEKANRSISQKAATTKRKTETSISQKNRKRTFNEKKELESLPQKIEHLEQEQSKLQQTMANPEFFKQQSRQIAKSTARLEELQTELSNLYTRWDDLESRED